MSLTSEIKQFARQIGFDAVGCAPADTLPAHERAFFRWLEAGHAGEMQYMAKDPHRRARPQEVLPGAKSVISLAVNYYPGEAERPLEILPLRSTQGQNDTLHGGQGGLWGRVARYAWGKDYHTVIETMLDRLVAFVRQAAGPSFQVTSYVDHGPVLEKAYAQQAGLGFIGKNTTLITEEFGSWVFLAEVITNVELEYDQPQIPHCGTCTLCLEACPTGALVGPYQLDARRCISYLTIELKGALPDAQRTDLGEWVFGCDICQEVCPYNQAPQHTAVKEFSPEEGAGASLDLRQLLSLTTDEAFTERFLGTPLLRPKRQGLVRNASAVADNAGGRVDFRDKTRYSDG